MQKLSVEDFLKAPYSRILIPDGERSYSAEILEFPGCFAQGETPNEAFENLESAAKSWIQASITQGLDIPEPMLNQGYSGKISLRIPRSLHKKAAQFAERDATSLNQFLITAIASRIGAEEYHARLCNKFENFLTYTVANTISLKSTLQQNFVVINTLPNIYVTYGTPTQAGIQEASQLSELTYKDIGPINYHNVNVPIALIPQET